MIKRVYLHSDKVDHCSGPSVFFLAVCNNVDTRCIFITCTMGMRVYKYKNLLLK